MIGGKGEQSKLDSEKTVALFCGKLPRGGGYSLTRGFHNWSDYNGVTLSIELLEWGRKFSDLGGK